MRLFTLTSVVLTLALPTLIAVSAGCSKSGDEAGPSTAAPAPDAATIAAGKALVASSGCERCHEILDQGGHRGPDLSHVGAEAEHTAQWIADYIKDPKSKDPNSRMPAFGDRVNDKDRLAIGAYLSTLK